MASVVITLALVTIGLAPATASAALSIAVGTPLSALVITPGSTATAAGTLVITPDVINPNWALSIADTTGHNGHLVPSVGACSGVESQTVNPLTVRATGVLGTTTSTGTQTVGATSQPLASGTGPETVTVRFSLVVGQTEILSTACTMRTTVTYTVT